MTADKVNGKMMEVKGKLLQLGIPTALALNLTYDQYLERLQQSGPSEPNKIDPKEIQVKNVLGYNAQPVPPSPPRQLDPQEQEAVTKGRTPTSTTSPPSLAKATAVKSMAAPKVKAELPEIPAMTTAPEAVMIASSEEEEGWVDPQAAPSGQR